MADNVENLVLEHLKRFQATLDRVERKLAEPTSRQSDTHSAVLGLRRDQVNDAEVVGHLQVELDGVKERLDRIESRLQLID